VPAVAVPRGVPTGVPVSGIVARYRSYFQAKELQLLARSFEGLSRECKFVVLASIQRNDCMVMTCTRGRPLPDSVASWRHCQGHWDREGRPANVRIEHMPKQAPNLSAPQTSARTDTRITNASMPFRGHWHYTASVRNAVDCVASGALDVGAWEQTIVGSRRRY